MCNGVDLPLVIRQITGRQGGNGNVFESFFLANLKRRPHAGLDSEYCELADDIVERSTEKDIVSVLFQKSHLPLLERFTFQKFRLERFSEFRSESFGSLTLENAVLPYRNEDVFGRRVEDVAFEDLDSGHDSKY